MRQKSYLSQAVIFFFFALILSGCASANISSSKSPDFTAKLSKLYLVIKTANGAKEFSYSFKTMFLGEMANCGVVSDYRVYDPLALESEKEVDQKISKFNPQVIILMTQTESKAYSGYNWDTSII